MRLSKEQVAQIIVERLIMEDVEKLLEAHLPPTDDVISRGTNDLSSLRTKLPEMTQIQVTDVVTLEMEALAKHINFKGIGKMKRASKKLRDLALEYKAESFELASFIAEQALLFQDELKSGLKDAERKKKEKKKASED